MRSEFIQTLQDYQADYEAAKQLGAGMLACNAMLVPEIAPSIAILFKTYPRPIVTNNEGADVSYAGGLAGSVAGVPKTLFEGAVTMTETETGTIRQFAELLIAQGGKTNCILYEGRVDRWTQAHSLVDCAFTFEPSDIDAENRSQVLIVNGNMKYMYFGLNASSGSVASTVYGGVQVNTGGGTAQSFLNKAQSILNVVTAGNSVLNAAKNLF